MPTYQYACTECDEQLEAVQSFSDDPLTECPACAGRLRKLYSSVGIVFKGSGFYRNDSRSNGKADAKTDTAPDSKTESKPAAQGESKPGSKPAPATASSSSSSTGSGGATAKAASA